MPLNDDEKADLVAYLDGELDEAGTHAVETRIATDPETRAELEALKQAWGLLDYLPTASPSPNFTHRTLERLTLEKVPAPKTMPVPVTGRPWLVGAGWAAAILIALGGGYYATTFFGPPPTPTPEPIPDADRPLVQHLHIVERWRQYEHADDLEFVKKLSHPDLFGEDPS